MSEAQTPKKKGLSPGIFASLFSKQNPVEAGIVRITSSYTVCPNLSSVIMPGWKQHWFSFGQGPAWISIEFTNSPIKIVGYSLKTYSGDPGCAHLRSWILEGSADASNWTQVDKVDNSQSLNGPSFCFHKDISPAQQFRFIRLQMTDKNHAGGQYLILRGIELYGEFSS